MKKERDWRDYIFWALMVLGIIMFIVSFFKGG